MYPLFFNNKLQGKIYTTVLKFNCLEQLLDDYTSYINYCRADYCIFKPISKANRFSALYTQNYFAYLLTIACI